jgi:hypothetical protein
VKIILFILNLIDYLFSSQGTDQYPDKIETRTAMDEVDIIPEQNSIDFSRTNPYQSNDDSHDHISVYVPRLAEPIVIRGAGHVTVFALNNKFNEEYPVALTHKVSRDEYHETIKRVNLILRKNVPINFKW